MGCHLARVYNYYIVDFRLTIQHTFYKGSFPDVKLVLVNLCQKFEFCFQNSHRVFGVFDATT